MFWKIFGISNLIVFIINYMLIIFMSWKVSIRLKTDFPTKKSPHLSFVERVYPQLKTIIMHLIPFLNIFLLLVYLFKDEEIMEKTYNTVKEKLVEKEK